MLFKTKNFFLVFVAIAGITGCFIFNINPFVGTWVYSASDGYYDEYWNWHTLYAEETLIFHSDGTMDFESSIEDQYLNQKLEMIGIGSYTYDGSYFSITLTLTTNDFGSESTMTISGSYILDGSLLSVTLDGSSTASNYYLQ